MHSRDDRVVLVEGGRLLAAPVPDAIYPVAVGA
jgi:hypothetical protein